MLSPNVITVNIHRLWIGFARSRALLEPPSIALWRLKMITRREALILLSGSVAGVALPSGDAFPAASTTPPTLPPDRLWLAQLGQGLDEEFDYLAEVEGTLPSTLVGTLYRNG